MMGLAMLSHPGAAVAQRASENALQAAADAFGTTIGRETIGVYGPSDVRGFSALDAGNARLEELYFDPVTLPSSLLRSTTSIKVGIAAQGFAFPAPTGVVDIRLRRAGKEAAISGFASVDSYGFLAAESTADLPITGELGLALGAGAYRESFVNGTTDRILAGSATLAWTPSDRFSITPFFSYNRIRASQAPPVYLTASGELPPPIPRRAFAGPEWALNERERYNFGAAAQWSLDRLTVRGGLFRSISNAPATFANLYLAVEPDGTANQLIVADPPARNGSTSGELRVDRAIPDGPRLHEITLTLRGRSRLRLFGGSDFVDLGTAPLGTPQDGARPPLQFSERDRDTIRQGTIGLGYGLRWRNVGEVSVSAQQTFYRKETLSAGLPPATQSAEPLLWSAAGSLRLSDSLALYASYAEGLEDSGAAPGSATNRNAPLPASRTSQRDLGARLVLAPGLRLVAGVYDLRKPYFQFDASGRYDRLGEIRNRGLEVSLAGALTPRLDMLAGAVIGDPRVSGAAVDAGLVGPDPVGFPKTRANLALEWRIPAFEGVRLSGGANHQSGVVATNDNSVRVSGRTTFDLGARYGFKLGGRSPAQLRFQLSNLTNVYRFEVYGSGVYDISAGRTAQLSIGIDW